MISKKVVKLLNEQIVLEAESSQIYLAMAIWAEGSGFRGTARFMYAQAEEERGHMFKVVRFLVEAGETPVVPGVREPKSSYKDIEDVFVTALGHEQKVTASVHGVMTAARDGNDYSVAGLFQWFVGEQVEEEAAVRQILDVIRMAGKVSMYLADKEIGAMRPSGGEK